MCYPACPLQYNGRPCNKKLTNQGDDDTTWFCDRCQQNAQPDWRYILAIQADDHTGHIWLTAFQAWPLLFHVLRGLLVSSEILLYPVARLRGFVWSACEQAAWLPSPLLSLLLWDCIG